MRGVDGLFLMHQRRKFDFRGCRQLGFEDHVMTWTKPARPKWIDETTYGQMSNQMTRLLADLHHFKLQRPGSRVENLTTMPGKSLATSLKRKRRALNDMRLKTMRRQRAKKPPEGVVWGIAAQSEMQTPLTTERPHPSDGVALWFHDLHIFLNHLRGLVPRPRVRSGKASAKQLTAKVYHLVGCATMADPTSTSGSFSPVSCRCLKMPFAGASGL